MVFGFESIQVLWECVWVGSSDYSDVNVGGLWVGRNGGVRVCVRLALSKVLI